MTLLQLVNNVLTRLREEKTTSDAIIADTDVYIRSIVAHVNDAKDRVEDAWDWSALRGTDVFGVPMGQFVALPNSADNHYLIKRVYSSVNYDPLLTLPPLREMQQVTVQDMRDRYQGGIANVPVGQPYMYAVTGRDPSTNDIRLTVYPRIETTDEFALTVDRVSHQAALESPSTQLLVPSLPVYTLATALASRERGEVGGTPTSELFAIADRHLSDAVAQDTALYPNEMDWYSAGDGWVNTNVRNY